MDNSELAVQIGQMQGAVEQLSIRIEAIERGQMALQQGQNELRATILQVQSDLTFWLISILLAIIAGLIAVIGLAWAGRSPFRDRAVEGGNSTTPQASAPSRLPSASE